MNLLREAVVGLGAACACSAASASSLSCWIKEVTSAETQILVTFESLVPLAFTGTAALASAPAGPPYRATYGLSKGQVLEVKTSPSSVERCELEPVLGPEFKGVSRKVWLHPQGTTELVFAGSVVKAKAK